MASLSESVAASLSESVTASLIESVTASLIESGRSPDHVRLLLWSSHAVR